MLEIQSLSVCVPGGCPNKCKFCVSRMHDSPYTDQIEKNVRFRDLYEKDYMRRLQFARDNGCNTVILTGEGEPLCNRDFLKDFSHWNSMISSPFKWIEIQTSGVTLDDECLRFLRNTVGVSTISLSLSDMFDWISNKEMNGTPDNLAFDIGYLCSEIKRYDFNLRLSLNMTDIYQSRGEDFNQIMDRAQKLGANQVTFRKLYSREGDDSPQSQWIREHGASGAFLTGIHADIISNGRELDVLPFGARRYSYQGISLVVDDNCMAVGSGTVIKYLVLRPNCKLYTRWDDPGSLLF